MSLIRESYGDRVRELFVKADDDVTVVAPFIKIESLASLLKGVADSIRVSCVTRWRPKEIAAGVSDPQIFELLTERGNAELFLVDALHAKLFVADDKCLVGSSNVTAMGLGDLANSNIEVLVETHIDDPGVATTLDEIERLKRPVTVEMARTARVLAKSIVVTKIEGGEKSLAWLPISRRPEDAYRCYCCPPNGFVSTVEKATIEDVARMDIQPGLDEEEFNEAVRRQLMEIPIAEKLLGDVGDVTMTLADVHNFLETNATNEVTIRDLWRSFVRWMTCFHGDVLIEQEIAEVGIRRAIRIG